MKTKREHIDIAVGDHMFIEPDFSSVILSKHSYPSCSETEQTVILTLTGSNIMEKGRSLLQDVLWGNQAGLQILIIPQCMEQECHMVVLSFIISSI